MEPQIAVLKILFFITRDVQLFSDCKGREKGMLEVQIKSTRALTFAGFQASADTS